MGADGTLLPRSLANATRSRPEPSSPWDALLETFDVAGLEAIDAAPGSQLSHPADLLREIDRLCEPRGPRRLLRFESMDRMVQAWGANSTRGFLRALLSAAA